MAVRSARAGLYLALLLYFYGTLFPFRWVLSYDQISTAWSQVHFYPFWDPERGRLHSVPDLVSNVLLAAPIGFLGLLSLRGRPSRSQILGWGAATFSLGLVAEILQLGIPGRHSLLTDALSAAIGGIVGATAAQAWGEKFLDFLAGRWAGPARTWLVILLFVIFAVKFGPLDLTLDVSSVRADVRRVLDNPWNRERVPQEEWNTMAQFVLLGALLGALVRTGDLPRGVPPTAAAGLLLLLPAGLEIGQIFLESHSPSIPGCMFDTSGAAAGLAIGLFRPRWLHPRVGLLIVAAGLAAAGLSPYHFTSWEDRSPFQWVPLVEYYRHTNAAALYDAGTGVLTFGLLGALLHQSAECRPWVAGLAAAALAFAIELAQQLLPARFPGMTDVLIAALGGWVGGKVSTSLLRAES